MSQLRDEIQEVLNRHSAENDSDTPDYVLARYLEDCLRAFDFAVRRRDEFFGRKTAHPNAE